MPVTIRLVSLAVFVLVLSPAVGAQECCKNASQVCICGVARAPGQAVGPNDLSVVRLGTLEREPARTGILLEAGDELTGTAPDVAVELVCPKGSTVKFSNAFRAVLLPQTGDQDCSFSLLSGSVDILTGEPTQILAGLVIMGSKRTQYGLRVYRDEGTARLETLVYEGEAQCQVIPRGTAFQMEGGSKALIRGDTWQRTKMSDRDIDRTASVYARMDVAKAHTSGIVLESPQNAYAAMKSSHAKVLRAPADWSSRLDLATWQVRLGSPRQALYHLGKVAPAAETNARLRAEIAVIQGVAYQEMGDQEGAARHFEAAKKIDPHVDRRKLEERYRSRRGGVR